MEEKKSSAKELEQRAKPVADETEKRLLNERKVKF